MQQKQPYFRPEWDVIYLRVEGMICASGEDVEWGGGY